VIDLMSGNNRRNHTKIGLIAGIAAALLASVAIVGWGLYESTEFERQADQQSTQQAKDTKDKLSRSCVGLPPNQSKDCFAKAIDDLRAFERDEQNLLAQRKSALWSYIMASAAVLGLGVSILGVWLVFTTFHETRVANEIARAAQRAWVRLTIKPISVRPLLPNGLAFHVEIIAQNMGQTVAQNFELSTTLFFRGQAESTDDFTNRIHAKLDQWKSEYRWPGNASLLPQDTEIDSFEGDQSPEVLKWWEGLGWPEPSTQPVFLAAVFYRTVNDPHTVHLSWRTWYIGHRDTLGRFSPRILQTKDRIEPPILDTIPFHTTLMHEEIRMSERRTD
jgi:hypothetical protein